MTKNSISNFSRPQIETLTRKRALSLPSKKTGRGTSDEILGVEGDKNENELCRAPEILQRDYSTNKNLKPQTEEGFEISQGLATISQARICFIDSKRPIILRQNIRFSKKHRSRFDGTTRNDNESIAGKGKQCKTKDTIAGRFPDVEGYTATVEEHQRNSANTEPANASPKDRF